MISISNYTNGGTSGNSIAIGYYSALTGQSGNAVAIGVNAGMFNQGGNAIAIGFNAGANTQGGGGGNCIAVGVNAGMFSQNGNCIAIGFNAGMTGQGVNAIAIGSAAGMTNQAANTIVINATGAAINGNAVASACYVAPIRDSATPITSVSSYPLYYTPSTGEINSRSTAGSFFFMNGPVQNLTGVTTITFTAPAARTYGNLSTYLTYNAGTFLNSSSSTMILIICGGWSVSTSATGFRQYWIQHSSTSIGQNGRLSETSFAPVSSDRTVCSVNVVVSLLAGESFYFVCNNSTTTLTSVGTYMSATLLN